MLVTPGRTHSCGEQTSSLVFTEGLSRTNVPGGFLRASPSQPLHLPPQCSPSALPHSWGGMRSIQVPREGDKVWWLQELCGDTGTGLLQCDAETPNKCQTQRSWEHHRFGGPNGRTPALTGGTHTAASPIHATGTRQHPGGAREVTAETAPSAAGPRPAHVCGGAGVFPPLRSGMPALFPRGNGAGAVNAAPAAYISGAGLLALPRPGHTGSPLLEPLRRGGSR